MGIKRAVEMAKLWDGEISDSLRDSFASRTSSRALKKIGFTRKKKTYGYCERDEIKRQAFLVELSSIPLNQIVYVDASGMDNLHQYDYACNQRGQRFHARTSRRQGRINTIANALCNHKLSAPFTLEGACNRTVFEMWLETSLLPTLVKGQVVVMDNATFHKGGRIQELIQSVGCRLLYLPPYSPDFNLH
jgi:hypothetical protein